jgi:hypothetical protein
MFVPAHNQMARAPMSASARMWGPAPNQMAPLTAPTTNAAPVVSTEYPDTFTGNEEGNGEEEENGEETEEEDNENYDDPYCDCYHDCDN